MNAVVVLRKNLARTLGEGHPWIFRDALEEAPAIPSGALVDVATREGRRVATGYWDAASPIAVRVLGTEPFADPEGELRARVGAALARRRERIDPALTTAFRWIHGEADRLPGVHVDLY